MNDWNIRIVDVGYKLEKDIYIFRQRFDGKAETLNGEVFTVGELGMKPTLSLTNDQLRALTIEIENQGISPTKEFTTGKLEATEKHLEDMRKLVFEEKEITECREDYFIKNQK